MKKLLLLPLLGAGCQPQYGFQTDPPKVWGDPNPADPQDTVRTDRVLQVIEPVVDALWVIDNSLSMAEDRESLAEAFPLFLRPFQDAATDWHVGVITTDTDYDGRLMERSGYRWIDPSTPNPVEVFTDMATHVPITLHGLEKGRQSAYDALSQDDDGFNAGFRRPGAYLHITVVTDEEDDSLPPGSGGVGKDEFVAFVNSLTDPSRNTFNSVVALQDGFQEERGQKYIDLTARLGGVVRDLNEGDWQGLLDELGGLQTPPPTDEFFLSAIPVPETIEVHVVWQGITWVYVPGVDYEWNRPRNSIQFLETMPPMGAAIEITYTVASSQVQ
jgi:hypothetical protein